MSEYDIRWEQRFANFNRAFVKLQEAVQAAKDATGLSELEKEGTLQRFEYTHELAWNVMKDYLIYQGNTTIGGSRDATREAFKINIIEDGEAWMDMIKSRNLTTYTYDEQTADKIYQRIIHVYYPLFAKFQDKMENLRGSTQSDIFTEDL